MADQLEISFSHCTALQTLILLSPTLAPNPKSTLLRLLTAELRHLRRKSSSSSSGESPLCSNLGYLSAICHVITHPSVRSVSRICKPIGESGSKSIHVDLACSFENRATWIFVSDRNPAYLAWIELPDNKNKSRGFYAKVESVIKAANEAGALKPERILFVFARGLRVGVRNGLINEFGAIEIDFVSGFKVFDELPDGWISVCDGFKRALGFKAFQIQIGEGLDVKDESLEGLGEKEDLDLSTDFGCLLAKMRNDGSNENVINFDTTGLIATVSGISNGDAERLLNASEDELKLRFKSNYEFVIAQAKSELDAPILKELQNILSGKKGIICQSVHSEFQQLVSMCGGPNEQTRASQLLTHLTVVSDEPSERVKSLRTTRKLAMKNKTVFGTGDRWHAVTVTANTGFVRAVGQTGMAMLTFAHRPRALTGD